MARNRLFEGFTPDLPPESLLRLLKLVGAASECDWCTLHGSSSWRVLRSFQKFGRSLTVAIAEVFFSLDDTVQCQNSFVQKCDEITLWVLKTVGMAECWWTGASSWSAS